jgi:serine/threonine protein kinase/Tol biopolymer transport system component
MPLASGTKLGPYEIECAIGAGGMGEVYRARDTRLDRTVAIKVLSAELTGNADLKARFEREARAISALNHPHICTLHDVGHQDGIDFLVMEYIEGEALGDRLKTGPLPTELLLKIGTEIADALEKAHRAGIIHRDLKPGNIMLTKSGSKLLDFGLAKPSAATVAGGSPSGPASVFTSALTRSSPASPLTSAGAILGTMQYMSPEQIQGQEADARSDIFAFGAVLYEMATAKRAFDGKTQASIVGSILAVDPPPVSVMQPNVPPLLDRVISICLAKDPDERFQSAHDVKLQLQMVREGAGQKEAAPAAKRARTSLVPWVAAAIALVLAIAAGIWNSALRHEVAKRSLPLHASLLPGNDFSYPGLAEIALSPDGRRLALVGIKPNGKRSLWVQDLGLPNAQGLADTDDAQYPFWSPDGRHIGFFANGKLKRVDAAGGPTQILADLVSSGAGGSGGRGGTWSHDGTIVYAPVPQGSIFRVPAAGGPATEVAKLDRTTAIFNSYRFPQFLPDGRHFLFLARGNPDTIKVGSLDGAEPKTLLTGANSALYISPGYVLFMRQGGTLMAQRMDPDRGQMEGEPMLLASGVAYDVLNHRGCFTAAANGTLVYQSGNSYSGVTLRIVDRSGKQLGAPGAESPSDVIMTARFSPDGQRVVSYTFETAKGGEDIWIDEPGRNLRTRFTFDPVRHTYPIWSADGAYIVFTSNRKGHLDLYSKPANLAQAEEPLLQDNADKVPADSSRDGKFLLYVKNSAGSGDFWVLPLIGDRKPFLFLSSLGFAISNPRFSPDGRWVAYQSNATGSSQVYITSFPDHRGVWQISNEGGIDPVWGPGGKEVFYLNQNKVYAVEISDPQGVPKPSSPKPLFDVANLSTVPGRFDVSPDGRKFLLITNVESSSARPLTLVLNWPEELKK